MHKGIRDTNNAPSGSESTRSEVEPFSFRTQQHDIVEQQSSIEAGPNAPLEARRTHKGSSGIVSTTAKWHVL